MRKKIGRVVRWILVILAVGLLCLGVANAREAQSRSRPVDAAALTPAQKAQVAGALHLQREFGDRIWPGLAETVIPILLFNDRYEFLTGLESPPNPWERVPGDDFAGAPYFRRPASNPQSFAVPIGDDWAASLGSLDLVNRELFLNLRRDLPPVVAQLVPYPLVTVGQDFGQSALLHEMFHVYQQAQSPQRFQQSEQLYRQLRGKYPYKDQSFAAAWEREGQLLAAALEAKDETQRRRLVAEFLSARKTRRTDAALSPELIAMEQEREWLEGTALYVEIRSHELAANAGWEGFRPGLGSWQTYFRNLEHGLGSEENDLRFYASGMAMARLLDRLNPDWKADALRPGVTLEQLLAET